MNVGIAKMGVDRRLLLRGGGALAGAAALSAITRSASASGELVVDMAEDVRTMSVNGVLGAELDHLPTIGDTFVEWGSLYPSGTIDKGLTGPDQTGAIGRWVCRGSFIVDLASGGTPPVATTVLLLFGDGISATKGQLDAAEDGIVTEGLEGNLEIVRIVSGGFGQYAAARGTQHQLLRGENDAKVEIAGITVPGGNYTFTFTFAD